MTTLVAIYCALAVIVAIFIGALGIVLLTAYDIRRSTKRLLDRR